MRPYGEEYRIPGEFYEQIHYLCPECDWTGTNPNYNGRIAGYETIEDMHCPKCGCNELEEL